MAILKYILPILMACCLTGCYEDFNPDIETKPVLCLNSLITAGDTIGVSVTHTWLYTDQKAELDHGVDDAMVTVYANGESVSPDYIAQEGDEIRIVAESAKYGKAKATVTVPRAALITNPKFNTFVQNAFRDPDAPMTGGIKFNINCNLTIDDRDKADNYFKLFFMALSPRLYEDDDLGDSENYYAWLSSGEFDYEAEPIFQEHMGVFEQIITGDSEGFMIFSDRQFAGRSYTMNLRFNGASYSVHLPEYDEDAYDCELVFAISALSRSYYNRELYIWNRDDGIITDFGNIGLSEPIWAYSNVSTGAGVVAARTVTVCRISLRDFIRSTMESL